MRLLNNTFALIFLAMGIMALGGIIFKGATHQWWIVALGFVFAILFRTDKV